MSTKYRGHLVRRVFEEPRGCFCDPPDETAMRLWRHDLTTSWTPRAKASIILKKKNGKQDGSVHVPTQSCGECATGHQDDPDLRGW